MKEIEQYQHLTKNQDKFLDAATAIQLDRASAKDAAFLARQFIQATLPHRDPKADTWSRRNGNFALGLQAGFNHLTGQSFGLPYGTIPRLVLFWITTESLRTKQRRLELGETLAQFMREVGLDPSRGGKRSDAKRLQEQMRRLFQARISFIQSNLQGGKGEATLNMEIAPRTVLWWDVRNPEQGTLWKSWIELGESFFEAITAAPIPVDTRALKALKRSPLSLDLYALCCYEAYRVQKTRRPRFLAWRSLMLQLGSTYHGKRAEHDFQKECAKALRKIQAVMPSLKLDIVEGGFTILSESATAIPHLTKTLEAPLKHPPHS